MKFEVAQVAGRRWWVQLSRDQAVRSGSKLREVIGGLGCKAPAMAGNVGFTVQVRARQETRALGILYACLVTFEVI